MYVKVTVIFLDKYGRVPVQEKLDFLLEKILRGSGEQKINFSYLAGREVLLLRKFVSFLDNNSPVVLVVFLENGGAKIISDENFMYFIKEKARSSVETAWELVTRFLSLV
jgi:hypothetical protein